MLSIGTNGTLITEELIQQLPREECVVSVSVDGTAFHHQLRVYSTFDDVRSRLLLLKAHGIPTALICTQADRNVHELKEVLRFAKENGFFFGSTPFSPIGRGRFFPQYAPQSDIVEEAAQLYVDDKHHDIRMMNTVGLCVTKFLDECHRIARTTRREFCGVAMAYIMSDGSVYPCSICASSRKYVAGNLRERSFDEVWANSFQDIRAFTFDKFIECPSCELSSEDYYCTSRCPVMAELTTGNPLGCSATPYVKASLRRRTELLNLECLSNK